MAAQSRISELEAEVRELKRETADGGSVAVLRQRVVDAERTAEEERSARLRGETANAQLMGTQGMRLCMCMHLCACIAVRCQLTDLCGTECGVEQRYCISASLNSRRS